MVRGKPSNRKALGAICFLDAILDQADDDIVGHQATRVHDLLGRNAQLGARLDCCAQHVTGGNLRNAVLFLDVSSLSAFAGARAAQ